MTIEEYKELMKKDVLKIGLDVENNSEEASAWCDEMIDLSSGALQVLEDTKIEYEKKLEKARANQPKAEW